MFVPVIIVHLMELQKKKKNKKNVKENATKTTKDFYIHLLFSMVNDLLNETNDCHSNEFSK